MVRASCIFGFLLRLFDVRRRSNQLHVRFFRPRRRNRQRQRRNDYGSAAQRSIGDKVVLGAQTEMFLQKNARTALAIMQSLLFMIFSPKKKISSQNHMISICRRVVSVFRQRVQQRILFNVVCRQ